MTDMLLLVDEKDNILGKEEKVKCHLGNGIKHRAITTFVFNSKDEMLLAKRSEEKMLWPGYWDSAMATHVLEGESYEECAARRIPEELGFRCEFKYALKFSYEAKYKDVGSENELCALLIGKHDGDVNPVQGEVSEVKWLSIEDVKKEFQKNPELYCPWFKIAIEKYVEMDNEPRSPKD